MPTLHGFGDSFTAGCCSYDNQEYIDPKIPFVDNTYIDILASELCIGVTTTAYAGASNEDIMLYIANALPNIKPNDIVIVGLTCPSRMNFPHLGLTARGYLFDNKGTKGGSLGTIDYYVDQMLNEFKVYPKWYGDRVKKIVEDYASFIFTNEEPYIYQNDIWMERWNTYFKSIDVRCYWWDHRWWNSLPEELKCDCEHWNQEGHKLFARILKKFMFNNASGKI